MRKIKIININSTKIFGKSRFGDRVYQKAPPIGGTFGEVSESLRPFALRATSAPVNGCRLELNLIVHPTNPKSNLNFWKKSVWR